MPETCEFCHEKHKVMVPCIHLNGTPAETLSREYEAAYEAVDKAITALAHATCNGRDYYVYEAGAWNTAIEQHQARMRRLQDVKTELEEILGHVCAVIDFKEQAKRGR